MDPSVADSLQAVRDTVVIVQAQSSSWLDWVSLGVSVLIAGFTGGYLYYTTKIFKKTEEQAEAAQRSAKAAMEANKVAARSAFYPSLDLKVHGTRNLTGQVVNVTVKNLSENPALDVAVFCKVEDVNSVTEDADLTNTEAKFVHYSHSFRLGDLTEGEFHPSLQTGREMQVLTVLLRFTDVLSNTYYLLRQYGPFDEDGKTEMIREWTTGLSAYPKYMPHNEEETLILWPRGEENLDNPFDDPPEPIRVFNRVGRNKKEVDPPSRP